MRTTEELMARSERLQARKLACIAEMTGVAHIPGRPHRTERLHATNRSREAVHVDKMSLLKYQVVPEGQDAIQGTQVKMTQREKDLRRRLELACQNLTQVRDIYV